MNEVLLQSAAITSKRNVEAELDFQILVWLYKNKHLKFNGDISLLQQVIPAYYDQNGAVLMGNLRGVGNGAPVRLVSPAPVLINGANSAQAAAANNMRLLGSQVRNKYW